MALTRAKTVVLLCSVLVVMTFVIVQQTDILKVKPKQRSADFKSSKAELKGVSNKQTSKITGVWTNAPKPKMKSVLITQKPKVKGLQNIPTATTTGFVTDKPKPKAKEILTNTPRLLRTSEAKIMGVSNTLKPKAMSTISENRKNNNSNNNNNNKPLKPIVTSVPNTTKPKAMSTPSENRKTNNSNNKTNNNSSSSSSSSNNNGNKNTLKPNVTSVSNTAKTKVMSKHSNNNNSSSSKNNKASKPNVTSVSNTPKPKVMSTLSNKKNNNKPLKPITTSVPNTTTPKAMSTPSENRNNNNSSSNNNNGNKKTLKPNVTSVSNTTKPKVMSKHGNNNNNSNKNNKASKPNVTSVSNTPNPKVMSTLSNKKNKNNWNSSKNNNNISSKNNKALKLNTKSVPNTPKPKIMSTLSNNQNNNNNSRSKNNKTLKPNVTSMPNTPKTKMHKWYYSPKEKESKWKRCKRLISGEEKLNKTRTLSNDSEILDIYKPKEDCSHVLQTQFVHPPVSKEEKQLPIAFGFTIYKGARLFERILQAIYMPNNVYCIHIDKKSPEVFRKAIQSMIRCLPNVFIAVNSIDVIWGHFTVLQAQYSCMEELLQSSVRWKYYISLVGQDFPLYDNKEIVRALQGLNNSNNIQSEPMPKQNVYRTKFVFTLKNGRIKKANKTKPPPPHNISIRKGSTHIIAIREFVEFVLHSQIGKDFNEFLKDTFVPDETLYSSLQRHPHVPGGIHGNQPMWIPRALYWLLKKTRKICHGIWVRQLCWITLEDLRWALGEEKKEKLFVHKIPFKYNDELIECILVARQGRKYATAIWKEDKSAKS